jgi:hypothetical protein
MTVTRSPPPSPARVDKGPAAIVDVDGILADGKHQGLVFLHPFKDGIQTAIRLEQVFQEEFGRVFRLCYDSDVRISLFGGALLFFF